MKIPYQIVSVLSILCILLNGLNIAAPALGAEAEATCAVHEEYYFYCSFDSKNGYSERLSTHSIDIELSNQGIGVHDIEFALSTDENLRSLSPVVGISSTITNITKNGQILLLFQTEGEFSKLILVLNNTKQPFDPIDVATLPFGQTKHPITEEGSLMLDFWVNISQNVDTCSYNFQSSSNSGLRNLSLQYSDISFENVESDSFGSYLTIKNPSTGKGKMSFSASVNQISGNMHTEITASRTIQYTPIQCRKNDEVVQIDSSLTAVYYDFNDYEFSLQQNPDVYYGAEQSYFLSFTALPQFSLRIDSSGREQIDSLKFDRSPTEFTVSKTTYVGEPCYEFIFEFDQPTNCSFILNLKSKEWLINSENMTIDKIPNSVKEVYLSPSSSKDGDEFSTQDEFVQQWASELASNQTNPYAIAYKIYENLTNTLSFPENWRQLDENKTFRENVNETLKLRLGVCRHFAKAYASLCICSGIPARTVEGTAFSFGDMRKKNHEWSEIYLPGYSWVTVDASWNQSFLLDLKHARTTFWSYVNGTLDVSPLNSSQEIEEGMESVDTMTSLILLCEQYIDENYEAAILLDRASLYARLGKNYEALIYVGEAYALSNTIAQQNEGAADCGYVLMGIGIAFGAFITIIGFKLISRRPKRFGG
jgi:transglutaminase-like putative cysteine protease